MTTVLELGLVDLAGTRFAVSPLSETIKAALLLGNPDRAPVNRPWLDWARAQLAETSLQMPPLWPLLSNGLDVYPEFLAPAPATDRLRAGPATSNPCRRRARKPASSVRRRSLAAIRSRTG